MKQVIMFVLLAAATFGAGASTLDYESIWKCDESKFYWYCDEIPQPKPQKPDHSPPAPQETKPNPQRRLDIAEIKTSEQLRQELKRREDLMVMTPDDKALVKDYLELWKVAQDKGALLAETWRSVVWQTPDLDYSLRRPVNNAAIKRFDEGRQGLEVSHLRDLAKEHGLIFFFRSDCPYCHQMAPSLRRLTSQYGIEVLGISIDGGKLPDFPNAKDGRAQAAAWGVERVPAVFIGSKKTGDRAAIGFGAMSLSEIVQRIFVLTGTTPGENF